MTTPWTRLLLIAAAGALPVVFGRVVLFTTPLGLHETITPFSQAINVTWSALWIAVLLVTYMRQPREPLWKLVLLYLYVDQIWLLGYIPTSLTWTLGDTFNALGSVVEAHILIGFPSGRVRAGFERRFVGFLYAFTIGSGVLGHLTWRPEWTLPGSGCTGFCAENLLLVWPNDDVATLIDRVSSGLTPVLGAIAIGLVLNHFRVATPVMRRALLPVALATPFVVVQAVAWFLSRSFQLDALNELLATTTFAFVEFIVPVGVLLGMLRARLQRSAVADLAVELARGVPLGGLRSTLAKTLRDPTVELAFAAADGDGLVDPDGRPFQLPTPDRRDRSVTRLERDGELLAVLVHDAQLDTDDPGLVEAVASVARMTLENERLAAQVRSQLEEVRASRQRIVEAGDAERRRVERDLHDGAQQRLVALTMRLEAARATQQGAAELIDRTTLELRTAIAEVRGLARGLHPTILTESGLRAAADALAERTPVPVRVEIPDERFDPAVESTAYFVIAEALTNVARYARATSATVAVERRGDSLAVRVSDDGVGGADPTRGSGLRGLEDRVAAVGGRLAVTSSAGAGTRIHVELPIAARHVGSAPGGVEPGAVAIGDVEPGGVEPAAAAAAAPDADESGATGPSGAGAASPA